MSRKETTFLKGLAILLIVAYHLQAAWTENAILPVGKGLVNWWNQLSPLILNRPKYFLSLCLWPGFLGVNIFFVLSGYGLTQKYLHLKIDNLGLLYQGMWHQIKKLYPAYFLAHPLVHLGSGAIWLFIFHRSLTFHQWLSFYPLENYLKSLLIFPRWLGNKNMFIFDGTWWFIGVIVQLYLLFPLLFWFKKKYNNRGLLSGALILTFLYRFLIWRAGFFGPIGAAGSATFWWVNFPARLAEFVLGMVLTEEILALFSRKWGLGLIILILGLVGESYSLGWVFSDFLLALAGVWLGYALIKRLTEGVKTILFQVGRFSYYLYLLQEPFLGMIIRGY